MTSVFFQTKEKHRTIRQGTQGAREQELENRKHTTTTHKTKHAGTRHKGETKETVIRGKQDSGVTNKGSWNPHTHKERGSEMIKQEVTKTGL